MLKTFLGAIALTIAVPALAQTTAPAADPHAAHKEMDHGKMDHGKADCCKDGKADCCKDGKADCCKHAKNADKSAAPDAGHEH